VPQRPRTGGRSAAAWEGVASLDSDSMATSSTAIRLAARDRAGAALAARLWPISLLAVAALLGVTATGATVRLTASGLGCESWPGCGGTVSLPAHSYHSYVEFGNRLFSVFPVVFSVALALAAWRRRELARWARWAALGVCAATLFQAPLGYLTVLSGLHPLMVMAHFLLTLLDIALAVLVAVEVFRLRRGSESALPPRHLRFGGLAVVGLGALLVVSGAFTTAAGPHPGDYSENVRRFGNFGTDVWLHVRAATVFGVALIGLTALLVRQRRRWPLAAGAAAVALVFGLLQAAVGELQYRTGLPWKTVLVHVSVAGILWASVVALAAFLWRMPAGRAGPRPGS
jgi:cytochrome c oxidase assembly protein subunit 15